MCRASTDERDRHDDTDRHREVVRRGQGLRFHHARRWRQGPVRHFREIKGDAGFKTLVERQHVQFEVTQGQKGPQASNIRLTSV